MRAPQDTSTRDALRRLSACTRRRITATLVASALLLPAIAHAQIRRPTVSASNGWWISGGAAGVVMGDVTDGASHSTWRFGTDPRVQYRATLEKALDDFTTFGVSAGFGTVDLILGSIGGAPNTHLPSSCTTGCAATTELWTGMAQFRSGGGTGFHTLFEASGGATGFRNFASKADGIAIPGIKSTFDVSGTLGAGFAYPLSRRMVLSLVQDFGMGLHAKTDLPEGTGRSWRVRNTRAALRLKFGGR